MWCRGDVCFWSLLFIPCPSQWCRTPNRNPTAQINKWGITRSILNIIGLAATKIYNWFNKQFINIIIQIRISRGKLSWWHILSPVSHRIQWQHFLHIYWYLFQTLKKTCILHHSLFHSVLDCRMLLLACSIPNSKLCEFWGFICYIWNTLTQNVATLLVDHS